MELHLRGGHVALPAKLDRSIALAAIAAYGKAGPHVTGSPGGHPQLLPDQGADGSDRSGERQHQSASPAWPRISRHELFAPEGATLGGHQDPIHRFAESRVICVFSQILVQSRKTISRVSCRTESPVRE